MNKIYPSAAAALKDIVKDGQMIAVGGFGPWRMGLIDQETWRRSRDEPNVLERDVLLKRAVGFDDAQFQRMDQLLAAT